MGENGVGTRVQYGRSRNAPEINSADQRSACEECGGRVVYNDRQGETACTECGLVVEDGEIDHGPEWRAFDSAERDEKKRTGAPTTRMMHDKGLSSQIGWQNKDGYGNALSARKRQQMQRLRTWDQRFRTQDSRQRNLKQALGEIERMASALGVPDVIRETAGIIYRRALGEDLLLGRSIEGVATAAVYAATKQAGAPRTIDEVAAVSRIDEVEFMRTYRYVVRELGLEIAPTGPEQYVPRFASELELSSETEHRARELLEAGKRAEIISGRSPVGLAAAAIYAGAMLANEKITQDAVSAVTDISGVTIRTRYKQLIEAESKGS